jgi:hypothetical protein
MTKQQVQKLCDEMSLIETMIKHDVSYQDAQLLHTYPDIRLGKKVEHYQTNPY